jgi:alanine racemase
VPRPRPAVTAQRVAEVDLGAVRHNVRFLRDRLAPSVRFIAVVKADGYGHGSPAVARAALEAGAWGLAVSTPDEAAALVDLVERDRLLALGGLAPCEAGRAVAAGCALTCHSEELAAALEAAAPAGARVPVHLKVDTGMGRLGCAPAEAPALARRIAGSRRLRLAGVFTHFASSDCDPEFTREQLERFEHVLGGLDVEPGLRHAANSAAVLRHPETALDAVRCGIALYGYGGAGLRPALALHASITQVKEVPAGTPVGYGRAWVAARATRVATISIGYEDGVLRQRASRGDVVIGGKRAPLIGRVSMDQITADVGEVPGVRAGDRATLLGEGITADEVAEWSGTTAYEVLTSIGRRVERQYV